MSFFSHWARGWSLGLGPMELCSSRRWEIYKFDSKSSDKLIFYMETRYCEHCGKLIDENNLYGKGRFCDKKCQARSAFLKGSKKAALNKRQEAASKKKTVICPACGKEFETVNGKFCSRYCSTHFSGNKSRIRTEESKKKISETLKNYYKNNEEARRKATEAAYKAAEARFHQHFERKELKELDRFCSCGKKIARANKSGLCQDCLRHTEKGKQLMSNASKIAVTKLIAEGRHKGWQSRNIVSYAEKFWIIVLDNNKVPYQREFVQKYGSKACERYFLDFFIEKNGKKIDLEIDGKQHKYEDRKSSDAERDRRLVNLGYNVYRIDWNEISSEEGKLLMKNKIDNFMNWYHNL